MTRYLIGLDSNDYDLEGINRLRDELAEKGIEAIVIGGASFIHEIDAEGHILAPVERAPLVDG